MDCTTVRHRAQLGMRAWMGKHLLSETAEIKEWTFWMRGGTNALKMHPLIYKCILQVRFSLCYLVKWSRQYGCFHFMSFAGGLFVFSLCLFPLHRIPHSMHFCITRIPFSFPQGLTSKFHSKHGTVWLDVNCYSMILSNVWTYPICFSTSNNTVTEIRNFLAFFFLPSTIIFAHYTLSSSSKQWTSAQPWLQVQQNLKSLMHTFGWVTAGELIFS